MEQLLSDLAAALRERLEIIRDEESRRDVPNHMAKLQAVSERIDAAQRALPPGANPRLKHFLENRSYDKALQFLEQADIP